MLSQFPVSYDDDEYFTFIDKLSDGSSSHFGCTWSVDVIPDGVIVHAPASAWEPRHREASSAPDQGTDCVKVDMRLRVARHQLLDIIDHKHY